MSKINNIAILIDGGFFIQRFKILNSGKYPLKKDVQLLIDNIMKKVNSESNQDSKNVLFRSYYYDSMPFDKTIRNASGKKKIDLV